MDFEAMARELLRKLEAANGGPVSFDVVAVAMGEMMAQLWSTAYAAGRAGGIEEVMPKWIEAILIGIEHAIQLDEARSALAAVHGWYDGMNDFLDYCRKHKPVIDAAVNQAASIRALAGKE